MCLDHLAFPINLGRRGYMALPSMFFAIYNCRTRQPTNGRDKAKVNAASRKWHKNNPGYVTEYMRQWRKDHREAYNAYHRSYPACKLQNSVTDPTGCATRLQQANSVVRNGFTSDLDYIACPAQNHSRIFHTRTERIPGYAWVVFLIFLPGIILIY
jgi:hypothetical protein